MVEIRRLQPSFKIALPGGRVPDRGRTFIVVLRRRADHLPPTPQPTPCVIWQGSVDRDGYGRMKRTRNGERTTVFVHRWVMEQVRGRPLRPDQVILHACDNPPCFRIDHLSVGSIMDNNADMRAKGRGTKPPLNRYEGECHPMAKLSTVQVRAIRGHYQSGLRVKTIAKMFDVSERTVSRIIQGIGWRHVPVHPALRSGRPAEASGRSVPHTSSEQEKR